MCQTYSKNYNETVRQSGENMKVPHLHLKESFWAFKAVTLGRITGLSPRSQVST